MAKQVREAIVVLERNGWVLVRQRGSHRHFRHPDRPAVITVAGKPSATVPARYLEQHPSLERTRRASMTRYLVIYEQGPDSWGAYLPDLPGCTAVGSTRQEVEELIGEAVEAHIEVLRSEGLTVPQPTSVSGYVAA